MTMPDSLLTGDIHAGVLRARPGRPPRAPGVMRWRPRRGAVHGDGVGKDVRVTTTAP